ncbi:hypothetical protein O181_103057 [Austropuccinia psidii MF-1]|uniref:Uncharacterized protein n=1 Tax=Austropuccinia psidii MF-1 TaxID=1389203 RepID=A0A9Q3JKD3_9BASI|nr:hypothetical protein [Austropuccinia psidii MF-1]
MPGDLEHAVKCICNHNCTLDDIENTLQDVRKRTNIVKYTPYKSSGFKEKQPFRVEFKDKPRDRVAEVGKKKHSCNNCGSTDHHVSQGLLWKQGWPGTQESRAHLEGSKKMKKQNNIFL